MPHLHSAAETDRPMQQFDEFIVARYADVVRAFEWVRRDGLDPSDIAQEAVMLSSSGFVLGKFATFDDAFAYCVIVGMNIVRSYRRPGRRGFLHHEVTTGDPDDLRTDHVVDAEALAIQNADLAAVFSSLPPTYQRVLLLTGDGVPQDEIAARMGLPSTGAVKQLLRRARGRARDALASIPALSCWRRGHDAFDAVSHAAGPLSTATVVVGVVTAFTLVTALGGATAQPRLPAPASNLASGIGAPAGPSGNRSQRGLGPDGERPVVGAGRPSDPDPVRASRPGRRACVPIGLARGCVHDPSGVPVLDRQRHRGTTVTVTVLGNEIPVYEDIAPLCRFVPALDDVECVEEQDSGRGPVNTEPSVTAPEGSSDDRVRASHRRGSGS